MYAIYVNEPGCIPYARLIAEAYNILCKEYGIEMIEWYYPFEDDVTAAFEDLCKASKEAIEQTISWYED